MEEQNNPELDSFRRQWREEVSAKQKGKSNDTAFQGSKEKVGSSKRSPPSRAATISSQKLENDVSEFSPYEDSNDAGRAGQANKSPIKPPSSALEHFEHAVEKENQGNLGDSLNHYRRAFRMDAQVDLAFRAKHYPSSSSKPSQVNPSAASPTVPSTAHHSLDGLNINKPSSTSNSTAIPPSTSELIDSFSDALLLPAAPIIAGDIPPPCPISHLPHEILLEVLLACAETDPGILSKLAQTCKQLAYLISKESSIWHSLVSSPKFGFIDLPYRFKCTLLGAPLISSSTGTFQPDEKLESHDSAISILSPDAYKSYSHSPRTMFYRRPRPRFGGVYIGVNNYTRPGMSTAASAVTWNTPVHIVTYYRYLRLYRDGTALSLLSTLEPAEVVPNFHRENLPQTSHERGGIETGTVTSVMKYALRGRWRMSGPVGLKRRRDDGVAGNESFTGNQIGDEERENEEEDEGTLHIETQGADPKYIYTLELQMASNNRGSGKRPQNTKLLWKHFFMHNTLTESWGEISLPHDKGFVWSRVGRYGA